jgi:hypothetical protein
MPRQSSQRTQFIVGAPVDAAGQNTRTVGTATAKTTFDKPGTYVLRAYAEDMSLFSMHPLTVTVTGGTSAKD